MKVSGICSLTVMLLTMGLLASGCGPRSPQEKIDNLAQGMQSQLPKQLDKDTVLAKVYTQKMELISEYKLLHFPTKEKAIAMSKKNLSGYLHTSVCSEIKKDLLSEGISSRYIYKTPQGVFLDVVLKPGDC